MAKPPKQFRLTFKKQSHNIADPETGGFIEIVHPYPLAFAIEHNPKSSTYKDRCAKQNSWAYGYHKYTEDGHILQNSRHYWRHDDWDSSTETVLPDNLMPQIIDNVPLDGFRIQHMVSRDRGNKLWRILDPRGFELEIGSGCMENLIEGGAIVHGLIVGACIWTTTKMLARV